MPSIKPKDFYSPWRKDDSVNIFAHDCSTLHFENSVQVHSKTFLGGFYREQHNHIIILWLLVLFSIILIHEKTIISTLVLKLSPIYFKKHNNKIILYNVMCKLGIHKVDACLDGMEAEVVYSPLRNHLNLVLGKLCYYSAGGWVDCDLED